ncbi:hypothetical protein [Micromonospora sp. NPDC049102]|uniref:hypothetical protein n=1 Tax=Micromonospora sp. NPDC049102 TaxID=3364265 RepID=UPI0037104E23
MLHDVFAVPFARVAEVLGTSEVGARQLASRARRAVTAPGAPRHGRLTLGLFGRTGRYAQRVRARSMLVDGALGLQMETTHTDGRQIRLVTAFTVDDGRITGIFNQLNPLKLTGLPPLRDDDRWPPRW